VFNLLLLKFTLCYEDICWIGGIAPQLTSILVGDEWLASRLCRLTPGERANSTNWILDWVDPIANLELWRKENSCNAGN
jgi:hypothetical protein